MKVLITDEFNTVFELEAKTDEEVLRVVALWLKNRDETPIYEITILID